jgi:hypothetical protein
MNSHYLTLFGPLDYGLQAMPGNRWVPLALTTLSSKSFGLMFVTTTHDEMWSVKSLIV